MFQLEKMPEVITYVKNDHLNFEVPYQWEGETKHYIPDYIIHLKKKDGSILKVVLEVKGFEDEKARTKRNAMNRWIEAVNNHGEFGKWTLIHCRNPDKARNMLEKLL